MIKNLLYVLAIAISTMSYGQTTTYTISHSGANHLVIAANGIFLNDDSASGDGTGTLTETTVTITSTTTWVDGVDTEPSSFATLWFPIKDDGTGTPNVFAKDGGFTTANISSDTGAGTSPRIRTWDFTSIKVLDQTLADAKGPATRKSSAGAANEGTTSRFANAAITLVDAFYANDYVEISNEQDVFASVTRSEDFTMSFNYTSNGNDIENLRYRILLVHPGDGGEDPYSNATIDDVTVPTISVPSLVENGSGSVTLTFPLDAVLNSLNVAATSDVGGKQIVIGSTADRYDLQKRNDTDDGWINLIFGLEFTTVNEAPVASVVGDAIENLKVYPNPTTGIVNISDISNIETITISNVLGQVVRTYGAQNTIDISDLKDGVYFLQADNGFKRKIVKK